MKTLKQEYLLAEALQERRIIAIRAANALWARKRRSGRFPSAEFYAEFLEPFIEYEERKLQLDEVHHVKQHISKSRERELAEAVIYLAKKCVEQLTTNGPKHG